MKHYRRADPSFSLCGLHCGLCPIHHMERGCPGCGGGAGHQSYGIIRCSLEHGAPEYCFQCAVFPCERLRNAAEFDSFVPHRNSIADLERARDLGLSACRAEQAQKEAILQELLTRYNDGRRKSLFCTAVCLLELDKLRQAIVRLEERVRPELELRARAALAVEELQAAAQMQGVELKLRKKPK